MIQVILERMLQTRRGTIYYSGIIVYDDRVVIISIGSPVGRCSIIVAKIVDIVLEGCSTIAIVLYHRTSW